MSKSQRVGLVSIRSAVRARRKTTHATRIPRRTRALDPHPGLVVLEHFEQVPRRVARLGLPQLPAPECDERRQASLEAVDLSPRPQRRQPFVADSGRREERNPHQVDDGKVPQLRLAARPRQLPPQLPPPAPPHVLLVATRTPSTHHPGPPHQRRLDRQRRDPSLPLAARAVGPVARTHAREPHLELVRREAEKRTPPCGGCESGQGTVAR